MLRGLHNPFCFTRLAFRSTKGQNGFKVQDLLAPDVEAVNVVPIQFQNGPCLPPPPPPGKFPSMLSVKGLFTWKWGASGR